MAETPRGRDDLSQKTLPSIPSLDADGISRPSSRRKYHRQDSWHMPSPNIPAYYLTPVEHEFDDLPSFDSQNAQGLGLKSISAETDRINRVPVGSKSSLRNGPSPLETGIVSGPANEGGTFSQSTTANNTPADPHDTKDPIASWLSPRSSTLSLKRTGTQHTPINRALLDHSHGEHHSTGCPTDGDVLKSSMTWFTVMILVLAVYSTTFSAIFLGISLKRPRYGNVIGGQSSLSPAGATLLSALFSKTVELSFATVFVATLGQMLSRKAFVNDASSRARAGGISIAQMNLRLWIMQPGTLITNWIGVKYALPTLLGAVTLLATVSAIFYTTAAEALVSPKSRMGPDQQRQLLGKVSASYANSDYLKHSCQTPISFETDTSEHGTTCLQMAHAGQAYHNFESWNQLWWQKINDAQVLSSDSRPPPVALMYTNTTVFGQWITPSGENITKDSSKWKRLVQNVTMAMPHANLFNAARDPVNNIVQVDDLQGAGQFIIRAAIPAPAVNVLCAGLNYSELEPMIVNNDTQSVPTRDFTTALDKIFGWTPAPLVGKNTSCEHAPWFQKAPIEYNTVANTTKDWGQQGVYLLVKPKDDPSQIQPDYVLCSIRSMQYPNCTSTYQAAQAGGNITAHCDSDPDNTLPYLKYAPHAPVGYIEKDWKDVATEWIQSIALNDGVSDANASVARMLAQMTPTYQSQNNTKLSPGLPSLAEALAVLAGNTLLLSSNSAPFSHKWKFTEDVPKYLHTPQYDSLHVMVKYADYASGPTQHYQYIFYIILLLTFGLNVWCMSYLVFHFWHTGHVTDYTEPQNLFALAINSPPSNMLAGACGAGPSGDMLGKKWYVDMAHQQPVTSPLASRTDLGVTTGIASIPPHPHFYVRSIDDDPNVKLATPNPCMASTGDLSGWPNLARSPRESLRSPPLKSPRVRRRNRTRTVEDFTIDESPAVEQFNLLIGKK